MVRPDSNRESRNCNCRCDQTFVTKDWLAAKDRQNFSCNSKEWKSQDIHLRMAKEPEEVLPEHCSTVGRIKDMRSINSISFQTKERCSKWRKCKKNEDRGEKNVPREDGHAEHSHTWCAHREDCCYEVNATENCSKTTDCKTDNPQIATDTW